MKTFYYVNGKKVDAGTYLEAGVTDSHNKKMAKKAKKYYENHPEELNKAYMFAKDSADIGYSLFLYYTFFTEEGKKLSDEFIRNKDKIVHREAGYVFLAYLIVLFLHMLY